MLKFNLFFWVVVAGPKEWMLMGCFLGLKLSIFLKGAGSTVCSEISVCKYWTCVLVTGLAAWKDFCC